MAWRDTRTSRGRLLLFSISIVLGVAGLAANGSLGKNLEQAVAEQSKTLLGADLSISSRRPFTADEEACKRAKPLFPPCSILSPAAARASFPRAP
jgi:putative ABC transport system permease protein